MAPQLGGGGMLAVDSPAFEAAAIRAVAHRGKAYRSGMAVKLGGGGIVAVDSPVFVAAAVRAFSDQPAAHLGAGLASSGLKRKAES